jgi:hypothetical protein
MLFRELCSDAVNTYISRNEWDIDIWVIQGFYCRIRESLKKNHYNPLLEIRCSEILCSDGLNGYNCHTGLL